MFWFESARVPILTLMTLLPLAAMIAILIADSAILTVFFAYAGILSTGLLSSYLLLLFDAGNTGIQLAEQVHFLGLSYSVGVDGANVLFIPLTTLLTLLALIYLRSTRYATDSNILACLLGYETILIGAFSALNAMQFWMWSCLELAPVVYFTLATGTGSRRREAVKIVLQFWGGGLLLTLAGFLLLGLGLENTDEPLSFDWLTLAQNEAPFMNETLIFILLMYGFAVRMPLFPFHAWLPLLAEQGGVVTSGIFIVGLKLGVYAIIRFVIPLLPGVSEEWSGLVVAMGLIGLFYGAILGLMQNNLRRLLAFVVISQAGILILGVFSFEVAGVEGSLLLSLAYGLAGTGLLFSAGFIAQHTQTTFLLRLGGLFDSYAVMGLLFLFSALCAMAMPGTPGFNAGHMLIEGVVEKNGWIIALLIGIGNFLVAVMLLWAFQRIFLVEAQRSIKVNYRPQTVKYEWLITAMISSLLLATGFYSAPWHTLIDTATGTIGKYFYFRNAIYNDELLNNTPGLNEMSLPDDEGIESIEPLLEDNAVDDKDSSHE
ncbi:MAG: proton-conducting transporter membrane subunit [Methylococcales bacterium]